MPIEEGANASTELRLLETVGVNVRDLPHVLEPIDSKSHAIHFVPPGPRACAAARHLVLDVELAGDDGATLILGFRRAGEADNALHARIGLLPQVPTRVVFPLHALDGQTLFLPRAPLQLKGTVQGHRLSPDEVERVVLSIATPRPSVRLRLLALPRLTREAPACPPLDRVLVDEFGQWTEHSWPGKTLSEAALVTNLRAARQPGTSHEIDPSRSRYGGSLAHTFEATGFFRTHHDGRRWWLVDPDGAAFFSAGPDCVRCEEVAPILDGTAHNFAWLPPSSGPFTQAASGIDYVGNRGSRFMVANLIRAFGDDWFAAWRDITRNLLVTHGFNTVANWSSLDFARASGLPYVAPMPDVGYRGPTLFRSLPDVFAPAFAERCAAWAEWLRQFQNDRNLIGYFLTNEPDWAFGKHNLASEMLEANPGTYTRRAFAKFLHDRYAGDARAFATAWNLSDKTFEAIEHETWRRAEEWSQAAYDDCFAFSRQIVRRWMQTMADAARQVLPTHLNLGVRWAWISSDLCYEVADFCDVFTINNYDREPPIELMSTIQARTERPVMIGEFHHGATDRGLPSSGIQAVATTADRGVAYRRYVELCASHPACVGAHYFQYADQPLMGRFDGENYNIGLVDVCCTPHRELLEAAKETHARLYAIADGSEPPTAQRAEPVPPIFF